MSWPLGDAILSRSLSGSTDSSTACRDRQRVGAPRLPAPATSGGWERDPVKFFGERGQRGAAGSLAAPPAPGLAARCSRWEAARPPQPSRGAPTWAARLGGRRAGEGTVPGSPPG